MYRFDWFERIKLSRASRRVPNPFTLSPVIWGLGFTSMLTDISTEMVSSVLPAYLFLHLKLGPLQYGIIDGLYNGFAVALLSLAAGYLADRHRRHKLMALLGYGLSALCKPALFLAGGSWSLILLVVGTDRLGKGLRTAPRDAILSMNAPPNRLASAFALHRSLDAGGALLGPIVAFLILAALPGGFDVIWIVSFAFAVLGLATLVLFVPQPRISLPSEARGPEPEPLRPASDARHFRMLVAIALLLAMSTISDGFVFIRLQAASGIGAGAFPLYFAAVSCVYMLASVPAGLVADRVGRGGVLFAGYLLLLAAYAVLLAAPLDGVMVQSAVIILMGLYYAGTEGVMMAIGSTLLPENRRTTGLAVLASVVGVGKAVSSVAFGWLMQAHGSAVAIAVFVALLPVVIAIAAFGLRRTA
jgi:MFS family permease